MVKFIEVKASPVALDLGGNTIPVLRITEKKNDNPRFFDVVSNVGALQYISFIQSKEASSKSKNDLILQILNLHGIKVKKVRITAYQKKEIITEMVTKSKDGTQKIINCNFEKGVVMSLRFGAKLLISVKTFEKIIEASREEAKKFVKRERELFKKDIENIEKNLNELGQIPISEKAPEQEPEKSNEPQGRKKIPGVI